MLELGGGKLVSESVGKCLECNNEDTVWEGKDMRCNGCGGLFVWGN